MLYRARLCRCATPLISARLAHYRIDNRKPAFNNFGVLLWRENIPAVWLPRVLAHLPAVLVDHAHLERKAATTALNLEKYRDLYGRVEELNAMAIEELQHFQLVLTLLKRRGIPFSQPYPSP